MKIRTTFIYFLTGIVLVFGAVSTFAQQARSLTLTTEPEATVWLDGVLRGVTDEKGSLVIKPVPKGIHSLRLRAFGFKEVVQPIAAAQTTALVKLVRTTDPAEIAYQNAEKMISDDKLKAIEFYKEAVRKRPKYAEAFVGLARAYADTGDYEGAHVAVKKARQAKPVFPEASAVEARIYRSEGDIDKAIESFERAIREGKGFQPEAHTGLALIFKDEAEAAAGRAEYDIEGLYYKDAIDSFEKAINQLSGTEPVVYMLLGQIYEKTGDNQKAIAVYERFLRDMPDNGERTAVESFITQLKKPQELMDN